jgi:hypothetical protein
MIEAGPEAAGFPTGCWHALLIRRVIEREFGVTYNVHYLATLLHTLGFSFQKARFVSDHLDAVKRAAWLAYTFPAWRAQAEAAGACCCSGLRPASPGGARRATPGPRSAGNRSSRPPGCARRTRASA